MGVSFKNKNILRYYVEQRTFRRFHKLELWLFFEGFCRPSDSNDYRRRSKIIIIIVVVIVVSFFLLGRGWRRMGEEEEIDVNERVWPGTPALFFLCVFLPLVTRYYLGH